LIRARISLGENEVAEFDCAVAGEETLVVVDADVNVDVDGVAVVSCLGWLNAPVLCFCSFSKSSCSSFGSLGGAGPRSKTEEGRSGVVLKGRVVRVRGERWRRAV
jgi:hypothetical protein